MINEICNWVASFPGFAGKQFRVDRLGSRPEDAALYCLGQQTLWRREDILGGETVRRRLTCRVLVRDIQPQQLLAFAAWAEENCPPWGQDTRLWVEQGALDTSGADGSSVYRATLRLEWTSQGEATDCHASVRTGSQ